MMAQEELRERERMRKGGMSEDSAQPRPVWLSGYSAGLWGLKGTRFDSGQGHEPACRLDPGPGRVACGGNQLMCVSLSVSPSPSTLSRNEWKNILG